MTLDNIAGDYGVVNAIDDLISALLIIFAKCNDGKTAEANILLQLTVYARSLQPGLGEPVNRILLAGTLCKPPIYRRTPLGRSISDLILAVPRSYGRADYLPVIAWGQVASQVCTLEAGAPLSLEGRIQSRGYRKVTETGPEERTAYEVSVMRLLDPEDEP